MLERKVSGIILTLLLIGMLTSTFDFTIAEEETKNSETRGATDVSLKESVDWWPMFHHDERNTGYSTSKAPEVNTTIWRYTTGGAVYSSPAVVDGKVYIGSNDYNVYCLNASTGERIWFYRTEDRLDKNSPAVAEGRVYVGSGTGLYCLDASTGERIWRRGIGNVKSPPAAFDGKVYIGTITLDNPHVHCLDASTGDELWNYQINATFPQVFSSPAVADGKVYIGSYDQKVYCFNASTGEKIWSCTTDGYINSSPAVVDGKVYIGSNDYNVYCLNAATGDKIWNYTTGGMVVSSPAVADGKVYVGSWDDHKVYCLNASSGMHIWNYTTGYTVLSSPAVASGKVYIGSYDHKIYALNASTGAFIWSFITGSWTQQSSPAVADGKVYIGSGDHKVYAFGLCHDVAVTNVIPSEAVVVQGYSVSMNVTVENQGSYTESFNVTTYANTTKIGKQAVANLNSGAKKILSFTWNTTGCAIGNYTISALADVVTNETDTADNTYVDGTVTIEGHDVAVVDVSPVSNVVPRGFDLNISVTVENQGDFVETFNVTAYANTTTVEEQEVSLNSAESATLIFAWNTTGFSSGNYTISAYATPVPEETDTDDNTYEDGVVTVRLPIYDVAVTNVTPSKTVVGTGFNMTISVTVENQGDFTEIFNATVCGNKTIIGTLTDITLTRGSFTTITFTWNTTGWAIGNYTISANATILPDETDTADNSYIDGAVTVRLAIHDIAVTDVRPSKTVVGQGYSMSINVTIENQGDFTETFNVTAYYNETAIILPNGKNYTTITLTTGNSTTITFTWNTTGVAKGNYNIRAIADTAPGETDTADNTYTDGTVLITIPGDINGDRKVDGKDIAVKCKYFGCRKGQPCYVPNADVNCDGKIDGKDIAIASKNFAQIDP